MEDKIKKWLFDIKSSIEEIESYFKTEKRNFIEFQQNTMLKRAIERDLEIIGEAVNRILKVDDSIQISNSKKIVGLRNQIIHAYDNIVDEVLWGIIINHIPLLKTEIKELLKDESNYY